MVRLVSRRLASTRIVLGASPGYLARHGTPTHPSELAAHRVISYSYWTGGDDWRFKGPDGEVQVRIHTNSGDTCRAAALEDQTRNLHGTIVDDDGQQESRTASTNSEPQKCGVAH